ncbi:beta-L-arabinofuranosidase domain-containing protein [Proteiniphilum sp. UBA5384]|uniref:beta-L-arabinofuranosidase domain-containing protein n=1 Tax=Proteiniphilum sp. UBA5384 TaxID=1947279 RepID=UPI0025F52383|nr:beta-L-arabinofuranosidase domain-containing protein [Proteiniphilum sp. UBA5384]
MKYNINRRKFLTTVVAGILATRYNKLKSGEMKKNLRSIAKNTNDSSYKRQVMISPYSLLPVGSIKPRGWIFNQMYVDLHDGLKGHFGNITSNVTQNLFAKQQRKAGTWVSGARGRKEKDWWAGEHEGYWMDSIVRSAILLDDQKYIEIVDVWVEKILEKFKETGYIGIYDTETRFPDKGFDGELWTQSRVFQALLAWYEYKGDRRILEAIDTTVRETIEHYRKDTYFGRPNPDGGVTHGVGYMDTLEWLWRLTNDQYFADAAIWLYTDYSQNAPKDFNDLTSSNMIDSLRPWFNHGAHVGEAIHMPRIAYFFSGNPQYEKAAKNVIPKIIHHTNPAGGIALGYLEAIAGSQGGGHTPSENCAHTESLISLNRLFAYEPNTEIGEWKEKCIYNVVQGARFHPVDQAVTYLARDNRRQAADVKIHGGRELFSACHEAAACCVLNVPRVMPYYVEGMWYRSNDRPAILVNSYGPSLLTTKVKETAITIEEVTNYPFCDKIEFKVNPVKPVTFEIALRIPSGCGELKVDAGKDSEIAREQNLIRIYKKWQKGSTIRVDFDFQVMRKIQADGKEVYWQWGPLVFSLPFPHKKQIITEINATSDIKSGFYEYLVAPSGPSDGWSYLAGTDSMFKLVRTDGDSKYPWTKPPVALEGNLYDRSGNRINVKLVPIGSSPLRRTTFPFHESTSADPDVKQAKVSADSDPMRLF